MSAHDRFTGLVGLLPAAVAAIALAGCSSSGPAASRAPSQATSISSATTLAPSGNAVSLQQDFVSVVKKVRPSVVEITTDSGLGSGVVYDAQGNIVTNAHVVGTAQKFQVTAAAKAGIK